MKKLSSPGLLQRTGFFTGLAASLCCFTPIVVLLGGSSMAANLSWIEPYRPFLIGASVLTLGLSWYHHLSSKSDCNCDSKPSRTILNSSNSLILVTIFTALMISFPYSKAVVQNNKMATGQTAGAEKPMQSECCTLMEEEGEGEGKDCCVKE